MGNGAINRRRRNLGAVTWAGFALCTGITVAQAQVTISVGSGTVADPGEVASVCVSLDSGGASIAATENEIHWDTSCITPISEACRANPEHGKSLFSRVNIDSVSEPFLKAIVISFADSDPIADGELYCCNFTVHLEEEGACCELRIEEPLVSSPAAEALATSAGPPGFLCLDSSAAPNTPIVPDTRTPTWTPSPRFDATATPSATFFADEPTPAPAAATRTATLAVQTGTTTDRRGGGDEDDGCQTTAPRAGVGALAWLFLPALLLWGGSVRRAAVGRQRRGR